MSLSNVLKLNDELMLEAKQQLEYGRNVQFINSCTNISSIESKLLQGFGYKNLLNLAAIFAGLHTRFIVSSTTL